MQDLTKPLLHDQVVDTFLALRAEEQWLVAWFGDWSLIPPKTRAVIHERCLTFGWIEDTIGGWVRNRWLATLAAEYSPDESKRLMQCFTNEFHNRFHRCQTKSMRSAYRYAAGHLDPDAKLGCPMEAFMQYSMVYSAHAFSKAGEGSHTKCRKPCCSNLLLKVTCLYDMVACGACKAIVPGRFQRNCMCSTCKHQIYCSVECQRAHRAEHRLTCFSDMSSPRCILMAELRVRLAYEEGEKFDLSTDEHMNRIRCLYLWLKHRA